MQTKYRTSQVIEGRNTYNTNQHIERQKDTCHYSAVGV